MNTPYITETLHVYMKKWHDLYKLCKMDFIYNYIMKMYTVSYGEADLKIIKTDTVFNTEQILIGKVT